MAHFHFADGAHGIDLSAGDDPARVPSLLRQALELSETPGDERALRAVAQASRAKWTPSSEA